MSQKGLIEKVIKEEEESFLRTLETGIRLLDKTMSDAKAAGQNVINGKDVFTLYDTFGFPLDLTELILRENGMTRILKSSMPKCRSKKREPVTQQPLKTGDWIVLKEGNHICWLWLHRVRSFHSALSSGKTKSQTLYQLVLDYTPFYAESGGQVGDTGVIVSEFETPWNNRYQERKQPVHIAKKLPEQLDAPHDGMCWYR